MRKFDMFNCLSLMCFLFISIMGVTDIVLNIQAQESKSALQEQVDQMQTELDELKQQNKDLQTELYEFENLFCIVEDEYICDNLELTEEEMDAYAKLISYFCYESPNATKTYVGCTVMNLMYNEDLTFWEAADVLGVTESDLENIVYQNRDMNVVRKIMNYTVEELYEISSGATFFCETKEYEKYIQNDMQVLFTSGNYTFFTDLTVG